MNKLWNSHIVKYYIIIRINNLQPHAALWFNLTNGKQNNPDTESIQIIINHSYHVQKQAKQKQDVRSQDSDYPCGGR